MDLGIVDYSEDIDNELLDLFYQSIYYKKKEFEYIRVPNKWIYRYEISEDYVAKIAICEGEIIGSLGVIIRKGKINNNSTKIGCFVDNCILPKYLERYDEVFWPLFTEIENELRRREVDVICGWDFLEKIDSHSEFFKKLGFNWIEGVNWYPGGFDVKGDYPIKWKTHVNIAWKLFFKSITYYHKIKEKFLPKLPDSINIRNMEEGDIVGVYEVLNKCYNNVEFAPEYSLNEFRKIVEKNNIHGIVAERNSTIIGALTYITSAWSGWMYGKPYYDEKWQTFFTFTPDEFGVLPKYQNTSIPAQIALRLLKLKSPHEKTLRKNSYGFIADVFDRRIEWRREAYLKSGCFEPKADYGVILAKSLREDISLDPNKIWYLPARYVLAPVPSPQELQQLNQLP